MNEYKLSVSSHNLLDIFKECKLISVNDIARLKHFIHYADWYNVSTIVKTYGITLKYKNDGVWLVYIPIEKYDHLILPAAANNQYKSIW